MIFLPRVAAWLWYAYERIIQDSIEWTHRGRGREIPLVPVRGHADLRIDKSVGSAHLRVRMSRLSTTPSLFLTNLNWTIEKAIINLSPAAPQSNADFKHSMHKTYTDCYRMQGFVGGDWAYAVNTNDTSGVLIESVRNQWVQEEERRLACYYLGWESIEVCLLPRSRYEDWNDWCRV